MNGAELLTRCLEREGVRYAFGLPGEENLALLGALEASGIEVVVTRDERGASFMANAWGRLTGAPGVCFSTLGPGATNLVTGIADALLDFSPLVAITAQASVARAHKESHQYIDVASLFKPITKWNTRILAPQIVPELVRKAFKIATLEKQGPTHLELSEDVADAQAEGAPLEPLPYVYPVPDEKMVRRGIEMIRNARLPVVLAGHGIIRCGASGALTRFAEKTGIAVISTFMGMGALPADHPLFVSTIGLQARDYVQCGLDRADLIIAVGYDPAEFSPKYWEPGTAVLHIDATPAEVDRAYNAVELVGDISATLERLAGSLAAVKDADYFIRLKEDIKNDLEDPLFYKTERGVSPLQVVFDIRRALGRSDILVSDVGAHKIWIGRSYPAYEPNTVLISNGFASMGLAVPSAIAAKLAFPDRKVVAAVGDGGFMMSMAELETAVRLGVPFVTLIFNDNCFGLIQWKELARYGRHFCVTVGNPDFVKLGESFGCKAYRVEKGDELPGALRDALSQNVPALIDCRVDYGINMRLTEKLGHIVCRI